MKNQELAHEYAHATEHQQGKGSSYFYNGNTIYSFGYHFIIAEKIRDKNQNVLFVLFNKNKYSGYTSCHQSLTKNALFDKIIEVSTDIDNFNPVAEFKAKEKIMIESADKYVRARTEWSINNYLDTILKQIEDIKFLAEHYRVKSKIPARIKAYFDLETQELLNVLGVSVEKAKQAKKKADVKAENKFLREHSRKAKQEKIRLEEWRMNEQSTIRLTTLENDFLRISKDGKHIETTQGVKIEVLEAKRLLKLIDNKKIIGAKVNDNFTVTAFNGFLKVGCHNVSIEEINEIRVKISQK